MIQYVLIAAAALTAALAFYLLMTVRGMMKGIGARTYIYVNDRLREKKGGWIHYDSLERFLKRNGGKYVIGGLAEPVKYLGLCIVFFMLGLLAGSAANIFLAVIVGTVAAAIPGMLIRYSNNVCNGQLLANIRLMYQFIAIQTAAGVYISDALTECCESVENRRLRDALINLSNEITMGNAVQGALENFSECFDNPQIDTFCVIIRQAMESGRSLDLLKDVNEQLKEMEENILFKKKEKLTRSIGLLQVLFFTGAMILFLYVYFCGSQDLLINF